MSAKAQWVQIDTITYGSSMASDGNNLYVSTFFHNGIRYSSNGGTDWSDITNPNSSVRGRGIAKIGNTLVVGTTGEGILLTTNLGLDWLVGASFYTLNMKRYNNSVIAGGYGGVYVSTNNGLNWTTTIVDNKDIRGLFTTSTKIVAGGRQQGGVYVSTNGGYNFTNIGLNDKYIVSVGLAGNTYIAGTDTAGIYTSTNEGVNWVRENTPHIYPSIGTFEIAVSGSNVFVATGYGCYVSNDYGVTWNMRNEGLNGGSLYLYITNGYLYSLGMGTFRRPLSELVGVNNINIELPSSYKLYQNYPNPFNPVTKIKFDLPSNVRSQTSNLKLAVYDLLGKEIQTLVNEQLQPGSYEVTFEGSNLPSGIYFYKLTTNDLSEVKKMILLK